MVKKNELTLNVAMFTIKGKKEFPNIEDKQYKNDIKFLKDKGFIFKFGSVISRSKNKELKAKATKDFYLKIEPSENYNKEEAKITMEKIKNNLQECLTLDIDYMEINNTNYFLLSNNILDYSNSIEQIKDIVITTAKSTSVHKIDLNEKIISPKNITETDLNTIDEIMERRIKDYNKPEKKQRVKQQGEKSFNKILW